MASSSSSKLDRRMHCVTCGIQRSWTPKWWDCEVCGDYLLCDNCYKGSLGDSDVLLAPQVHCGDHPMSAHVAISTCDGCGSSPIWNLRWHCEVCRDFDLCRACYGGGLDVADMPPEHSKEHPMIGVEVICTERFLKFQPNFNKPMDAQWSYEVNGDRSYCDFKWVKRKPMSRVLQGVDDATIHTSGNANEDNSIPTSELKKQINLKSGNLFSKQALQATHTQGMFDSKHKVFLSHAGTEKDFVEQLNRDLSRVHHFGIFFDKEDESLPKGEPFPKKIFDAAKHCELAIVVISHEYFIRKWPMLELTTFVKAQKTRPELKILPVFYKLSVEEFKHQKQLFLTSWKEMGLVSKNEMEEWKEALKVISRTNGLEYNKKMGEVAFRDTIVETIYKRVNPELMWDDSHVQGKAQMEETVQEMIQLSSSTIGEVPLTYTLRMGLFGMGGSGKTTMCKVFYNQIVRHYLGKVCHIEFGSISLLHLRTKLLQSICELAPSLLEKIDEGQALTLLKTHIPMQRVCFILDNVCVNDASVDAVRTLLNLPFEKGSLILVTSRSSSILENLNIEKRLTMRMPSLRTHEAKALFSQHAKCDTSSLTEEQMKTMENFVERCNFKAKDVASPEYHPLALKVLGKHVGPNVEEWQNIRIDFKRYQRENNHPIFSILRSNFDILSLENQKVFLDIALVSGDCNTYLRMRGLEWRMRCLYDEIDKQFISGVVKFLQEKSLVEFYDVVTKAIYVHDLYREFARMEVEKKGLRHSPTCCFSRGSKRRHAIQERRVHIHDHPISHITKDILSCTICLEAGLLSIEDCANLISIDVPGMQNLRMFHVFGGCPQLRSVKLEGAVNLNSLSWSGFEGECPDLTSLESLEDLQIQNDKVKPAAAFDGCLDFSKSSNLEALHLSYLPSKLLNLNKAVLLKDLTLQNCQHLERFEGLAALAQLERASLQACSSLLEFPSLANFPSLKVFHLTGAAKLKSIQGFASLIALEWLSLADAGGLEELPGIEACTRLSWSDLHGTSIKDCSWISVMKDVTCINLECTKIRFVPDCSGLYKLSELWLDNCQALESVGGNITRSIPPTFPQSLQRFSAENCRRLNAIPQFHHESALHYLNLYGTSVEDVSGVTRCKQLRKLVCAKTRITSLPDLSSLTRLEALAIPVCELLTRMDNTKSLPSLEALYVFSCSSLVALPNLRNSTGLTELDLFGCPLLDPNTVMLPNGSIAEMDMELQMDMDTAIEDATDHNQCSDNSVDAQECCEEETSAVTDVLAPDSSHNPWRCATLINLVAIWWRWVGSCCGGDGWAPAVVAPT